MVTHRGTAQNDDTVQVAAEPAGGPKSETTLALLRNGPCPNGIRARLYPTAPHHGLCEAIGSPTIPSSAASAASPLQRVVRPRKL